MNINISKSFANREELDQYVKSRFGDDASKNIDVTLELTAEEMQKLALDESTTVHGAKVTPIAVEKTDGKVVLGGRLQTTKTGKKFVSKRKK